MSAQRAECRTVRRCDVRPARTRSTPACLARAALPLLALLVIACNRPAERSPAELDGAVLAGTAGSNAIYFHRSLAVVDSLEPVLLDAIRRTLDSIARFAPVDSLRIRVVAFPDAVLPPFGISAVSDSGRIDIFIDQTQPELRQRIGDVLLPTVVHEYYHVLRHPDPGYGGNLFEAMVSEGLAEHFVREVAGRRSPWLAALPGRDLGRWRALAAAIWCSPEYDHAAWFGRGTPEIPRGTGFELGYQLVAEHLGRHADRKPSMLYSASPRQFLPPELQRDAAADCWLGSTRPQVTGGAVRDRSR